MVNDEQMSLLYGTLLGDAWIYKDKKRKNVYNFYFSQANCGKTKFSSNFKWEYI